MVMIGQIKAVAIADDDRNRVHDKVILEVGRRLRTVSGDLVVDLVEAGRILCRPEFAHLQTRYHERFTHLLLAIDPLMGSLGLLERIDHPQAKSNRGYKSPEFIKALILVQHGGSFTWMIFATFKMIRRCALYWGLISSCP